MTKAYSDVRKELSAQNADSALKCRYCGDPTPWEVLSALGSRCSACFKGYCAEGIKPRRQAQTALPRTPGCVNVMPDRSEPASAGPEHAVDALPFD